jgi:protein-tyrosine phosphatase
MNMVQQSDYILVMEHRHLRDIEEMLALSPPPEKVLLLGSFLPGAGSTAAEIPDPYFGDAKGFSEVFDLLDDALEHLLENVLQQLGARTD